MPTAKKHKSTCAFIQNFVVTLPLSFHKTIMKRLLYGVVLMAALAACKGETKAPSYEAKRDSMLAETRHPQTERMSDYNYTAPLEWPYADAYSISRRASDSLGVVIDADGSRYVNNSIRLALNQGSHNLFAHTYTKADFASMGDADFFRRAILDGMAFDGITDDGVRFIASIGVPMDDEYVQFAITISHDGSSTIEPTEIIDNTLVEEASDEE